MNEIDPHWHQFHFQCWIIYKNLALHKKIIPRMAQWKRIGFKHGECAGSTLLGRRKVRRSNSLLRNFWPEKLPHHRWPSQLTQSCRICLWIKFSKTLSKILLHSTTSTTNTDTFTYYYLYFDLKYTICKITLKTHELSIPDNRARTRTNWDENPHRAVLASALD